VCSLEGEKDCEDRDEGLKKKMDGWRYYEPSTSQIKVLACLNLNTWLEYMA